MTSEVLEQDAAPSIAAAPEQDGITIVDAYRTRIDPLSSEEYELLKASIETEGCRDALVLSHGRLIDGHNRLEICREIGASFETVDLRLGSDEEEINWIVNNQLGRRNLHPNQKSYLRGQRYNAEKKAAHCGENQHTSAGAQSEPQLKTAERLAKVFDVSPATIKRDAEWAAAVDAMKAHNIAPHQVLIEDAKPRADAIEFAQHIDQAVPELIEAVRNREIPIRVAAPLATAPPDIQRAAAANPNKAASVVHNHRAQGTGENEWYTPQEHIEASRDVLGGFDLDPASSPLANETVGAATFFTREDNGLSKEWSGRVYLNPPYSQPAIAQFAEKLASEWEAGNIESAIALTHNYTDTKWFHRLATACQAICFTRGRIGFVSPSGEKAAPTQGQAFFYFGQDTEKFSARFRSIGFVVEVRA